MSFIYFFNEIAIFLVFGFFVAGILHIIFPDSFIKKHLGKSSAGSVLKSSIFGIPLPICSCGVIPVATSLRNSGASKGATISFLISTPQVGADSFMITASLFGWIFGVFRIIASLITALTAGLLVNLFFKDKSKPFPADIISQNEKEGMKERFKDLFNYIEYTLLGSIANSLIIGIILAGLIAVVIPEGFFSKYLSSDFLSMVLMLVIGIPMYVCATASTPIAASLVMKGISPGAALIFLLTGPATNIIGISAVHKLFGKKLTALYLVVIAVSSLALGYALNVFTNMYGFSRIIELSGSEMLPLWLKIAGSIILFMMLAWYYLKTKIIDRKIMKDKMNSSKVMLNVEGMSCNHCSGTVKKALESIENLSSVNVDLEGKKAGFETNDATAIDKALVAIKLAGFTATLQS